MNRLTSPISIQNWGSNLLQISPGTVITAVTILALLPSGQARSQEKTDVPTISSDLKTDQQSNAGHSYHHEVLDAGPRQAAYLMHGMPNVHFKISCSSAMAQRFFDQGLGQLHGFWYLEAERSFRQVASFDPKCGMAYWGMAMANLENASRAKDFVALAMDRREGADDREKRLIVALSARFDELAEKDLEKDVDKDGAKDVAKKVAKDKSKSKKTSVNRYQEYIQAIDKLSQDYPDEIEFKAMLAVQMWEAEKKNLKITSRMAVEALLKEIFQVNPRHPAHHYQIHLWDDHKPKLALRAAANCGQSGPGIAHLWHMPGHTYSKLHRYQDAAWQQEASARVDHQHMMRDRVLPDQIHNYAHNQEWLVRNLNNVGRVRDAISLAKNMIELPRHPSFNSFEKRGTAMLGRERLIDTLVRYKLWNETQELLDTSYLEPTVDETLQEERIALSVVAGIANTATDPASTQLHTDELQQRFQNVLDSMMTTQSKATGRPPTLFPPEQTWKTVSGMESFLQNKNPSKDTSLKHKEIKLFDGSDPSWHDAIDRTIGQSKGQDKSDLKKLMEQWKKDYSRLEKLAMHLAGIEAWKATTGNDYQKALQLGRFSKRWCRPEVLVEWLAKKGETEKGNTASEVITSAIKKLVDDSPGELVAVATAVRLAKYLENSELSQEYLQSLQELATNADRDLSLLSSLPELTQPSISATIASDVGDRPPLDTLGPFRWSPYSAPIWSLVASDGITRSSKLQHGKPTILFFYLGFGCLHCVEQLEALTPHVESLKTDGIECIGISNETMARLQEGVAAYGTSLPMRLVSNPELDVFREYRCFDDFEGQPLHGTFLIDSAGYVVWQDIGPAPFVDIDFLITEARRLVKPK